MPTDDWERGYAAGFAKGVDYSESPTPRGPVKHISPSKSPKKKRKASAYNKRYAAAYKRLKKKHPRTSFAALAKKAHKLARRK